MESTSAGDLFSFDVQRVSQADSIRIANEGIDVILCLLRLSVSISVTEVAILP